MVTLSATSTHTNLRAAGQTRPVAHGFFSRLLRSFIAARQRRAERDVAEILHRQGGVMQATGPVPRTYPFHTLRALGGR